MRGAVAQVMTTVCLVLLGIPATLLAVVEDAHEAGEWIGAELQSGPRLTVGRSMLTTVRCQNFRCLQDVEIPLDKLTAIVGPNGSGKSAILRAIDLAAGPVWPSLQRLRQPHDFTGYDDSLELAVTVGFERPFITEPDRLGTREQIHALRVRCRPYRRRTGKAVAGDPNFDYDPLDAIGEVPLACIAAAGGRPRDRRPHRVTAELRDHVACVLIDHRRAVSQHLPGTRGSVLSRLLAPALKHLDQPMPEGDGRTRRQHYRERYEHANEILRSPYLRGVEEIIETTTRRTLGFAGNGAAHPKVSFQLSDPVNPYSSLRLVYSEDGLDFPADEVGLGVQSAIVVGIFEALRQTNGSVGTVLIDEPEMYLHPQAQRHFHNVLVDLVEHGDTQVIYSTHSPVFADATRFESLRLARRRPGSCTTVAHVSDAQKSQLSTSKQAIKLQTEYDTARAETLFADGVLLVEGKADLIAARAVASRMKTDLDARNLTVMECGGKASIPFHAGLCQALRIPVCVLYDDDLWPKPEAEAGEDARRKWSEQRRDAETLNARIAAAVPAEARFVASPTLEALMDIGRDAKNKPLLMAERIQSCQRAADVPEQLIKALQRLDSFGRPAGATAGQQGSTSGLV
jgi:energy-coupling factor transporter ATP-binding protein EcfA2